MADHAPDRIKVRHKSSLAETDLDRGAFEAGFFPEYEQIDSAGRRVGEKSTGDKSKES